MNEENTGQIKVIRVTKEGDKVTLWAGPVDVIESIKLEVHEPKEPELTRFLDDGMNELHLQRLEELKEYEKKDKKINKNS